jgi:hypothetical protein
MGFIIAFSVLAGVILFFLLAPRHWIFQQPPTRPESAVRFEDFLRRVRAARESQGE